MLEEIEGDLLQRYERDLKSSDHSEWTDDYKLRRAERRLLWNTIRFFRPGIIQRNKLSSQHSGMILNYMRFSFRSMRRHSLFTFINVTGLAVGIAVCLLMQNYVSFEKRYDTFFPRSKDIVRISYSRLIDNELQYSKAQIFPAVGETLK